MACSAARWAERNPAPLRLVDGTMSVQSLRAPAMPEPAAENGAARSPDTIQLGRRLAEQLSAYRGGDALVLALPPAGVPVAGELARALRLPLDALAAREFSVRPYPEVVAGALCEGGGLCLNAAALRLPGVTLESVWEEVRRTAAALADISRLYRGQRPLRASHRLGAVVVSGGIWDGALQLAAIHGLRNMHVRRCVIVAPFAVDTAASLVARYADGLIALEVAAERDVWAGRRWAGLGDEAAAELLAQYRGYTSDPSIGRQPLAPLPVRR